jgi:hypothetical protein
MLPHNVFSRLSKLNRFIIHHVFIIYFIIANCYLAASNIPLTILASRTPSWAVFFLTHDSYFDYNGKVGIIREGANGEWLWKAQQNAINPNPSIFYFFYILVGKVAYIFKISPFIAYHVSKLVSAELLIICIYLLSINILGKKHGFYASVFAIISTYLPNLILNDPLAITKYLPWWHSSESLQRMNLQPHYIFSFVLMCLSVNYMLKCIHQLNKKYCIFSCLTIFFAGIFFPPSILPLMIGIPVIMLVTYVLKKNKNYPDKRITISLCLIFISGLLAYFLIWGERFNGPPYNIMQSGEITQFDNASNFNFELLFLFGIMPLIAIPAVIKSFSSVNIDLVFISLWAYLPYILGAFSSFIGISRIRLVTYDPYIPFAILSTLTIFKTSFLQKFTKLRTLILLFLIALSLSTTIYSSFLYINDAKNQPLFTNLYIPKGVFESLNFIHDNIPKDSRILTHDYIGPVITAHAKVNVYMDDYALDNNRYTNNDLAAKFYSNKMEQKEVSLYLHNNKIDYVYQGPFDAYLNYDLKYNNLSEIFRNNDVIIYKVN